MELRDRLERNAALAEEFCRADERVAEVQRELDDVKTERVRILAALAVTVGSDSGTAHLLGMHEREVRVARRTVGRAEARETALSLLEVLNREEEPHPEAGPQAPEGYDGSRADAPGQAGAHGWTSEQDAALADGWARGADPEVLAAELGVTLHALALRVRELASGAGPDAAVLPGEHAGQAAAEYGPTLVREQGRHRRQRAQGRKLSLTEALAAMRELMEQLGEQAPALTSVPGQRADPAEQQPVEPYPYYAVETDPLLAPHPYPVAEHAYGHPWQQPAC
jgi:hypothetical protein